MREWGKGRDRQTDIRTYQVVDGCLRISQAIQGTYAMEEEKKRRRPLFLSFPSHCCGRKALLPFLRAGVGVLVGNGIRECRGGGVGGVGGRGGEGGGEGERSQMGLWTEKPHD